MSGIAGIIRFDGVPVDAGIVAKMTATMAYRGVDGVRHWTRGPVALGHCLLRTTEESAEERQPVVDESGRIVLVYDGWLGEPAALRRELLARGARLRNRSDSELVLRAYEAWGAEFVKRLDGDFALVVHDGRRDEVLCARDPLGHRPLHYAWDGRALVFASDIHPVFEAPWVREVANEGMVAEYLAGEFHTVDETLWAGVSKLRPAHRMRVRATGVTIERYWAPPIDAPPAFTTDGEFVEAYRALITDCVRRAARSHRPVACDVSGGLDSSAVFCLGEALRRDGALPAPGIEGFTLAFDDDSKASELPYARAVAAHARARVTEVEPSMLSLGDYEARARTYRDFPGFGNATMFLGLRARASATGCRVTLSGDGGDAWLQGSHAYYAEELASGRFASLADCFRADAGAYGARHAAWLLARYGLAPMLPATVARLARRAIHRARGYHPPEPDWLSPRLRALLEARRARSEPAWRPRPARSGQADLIESLDMPFWTIGIDGFERDAAVAGLEPRHPLRDPRFVEFAFRTPERLRLRGDQAKLIHVRAMQDTLPRAVTERQTKAEFSDVIRRQLAPLEEEVTRQIPARRSGWLDSAGVGELFGRMSRDRQKGYFLWPLWGIVGCDRLLPGR